MFERNTAASVGNTSASSALLSASYAFQSAFCTMPASQIQYSEKYYDDVSHKDSYRANNLVHTANSAFMLYDPSRPIALPTV